MKYKIYQIVFTRDQVNEINANRPDWYYLYLDTTFRPTVEAIQEARHMYKHVANITANDLDDMFRIGNIGPESGIERLSDMKSVSVGDVIVDETNKAHFVQMFGFDPIEWE